MNSVYNSRAWTYQERLLSRRCIYFMDNMVYFHCRRAIRAENKTTPYTQWTQDIRQLSLFKTDPIFSGDPSRYSRTLGAIYAGLVTEYTLKHLTFPGDILNSFSGIGASMEKLCGWRFVAGLPENLLEYALLWVQTEGHQQRRSEDSGGVFPSWSWAGWTAAVHYDAIYRTESNHEPFFAEMRSLISELHIFDAKTARFIQNSVATSFHQTMAVNEPPPTNVPQWLGRLSDMQISKNVLIFRALTLPLLSFRQFLASRELRKGKVIYIFSIEPPTNTRGLGIVPIVNCTVYDEIEKLSATLFADLKLEVAFLSLVKGAGLENETWHGSYIWMNFMIIQWNGDFAERKFVGQIVQVYLRNNEASGRISIYVGGHQLLRHVNCCWKTIRLT
jgi:hypothetical protein